MHGVKNSKRIMQSPSERAQSVPGSLTLFHELSSSLITKIYLCDFNNTKAVIRFDLAAASQLSINRQNEVNLLKSIGSLGIAPEVLYSDAEGGILIWKYIMAKSHLLIKIEIFHILCLI